MIYTIDEFIIATYGIYYGQEESSMSDPGIAKLFRNGRSQAVRLPREVSLRGHSGCACADSRRECCWSR